MSFTTLHNDSNRILNRLLECVQHCQKRFGGKTELATEFDACVSSLCAAIEAVYLHGLRNKPLENVSALKQMSDIVTNSLHLYNDCPSFWPFVKKHLTKHEQDRYNVLKHIWTDTGRGKAWIRSSLNERSLERYFHTVLSDRTALNTFYEDWALLCDDEKSSLLPNMAAGLASILFAVSIDKPELNSVAHSNNRDKYKTEPIIEAPLIEPDRKKQDKRKRKVAKQLISFDDDNDSILSSSIPSTTSSASDSFLTHDVGNRFTSLKLAESTKMEEEVSSSDTQSSGSIEVSKDSESVELERKLSMENSGAREKYPTNLEGTLVPLEHQIGELTPVSIEMDEDPSGAVEIPTDVSAVLTAVETRNREEVSKLQDKIQLLAKENENLRDQVCNYMGAVKLLDGRTEREETEPVNYKDEAKLYEQKLVQVAAMHAELMDFNVVLQKSLCQKDALLERLKGELEELRGPVSDEQLNEELHSCVNVWVPSAFLTGSGSESHHVYQIFLRAGSDEWNIYRRFAQFHALHSDLKKLDPIVSSFDFPPKKSLRNKQSSVVEDRRKRFQAYLRRILHHWPELSQCNSRFLLEQHLAFFKDNKKDTKRTMFTSRRSGGGGNPSHTDNQYSGL